MKGAHVFWLTGLSGSGKTTIAERLKEKMTSNGLKVKIVDGDDVRKNKHANLGFSPDDIKRNNELIAEFCLSIINDFDAILVSVIAPFRESRQRSSEMIGENYFEVYVKASLETVIKRDAKGLYNRALNNEIENFVGISENTPYDVPEAPDIILDTEKGSVEEAVDILMDSWGRRNQI